MLLDDIRKQLDENPEFKDKVVFPLRGNLYLDSSRNDQYPHTKNGFGLPAD